MSTKPLGERERAMEDMYARKRDQELIDKLRKELEQKHQEYCKKYGQKPQVNKEWKEQVVHVLGEE